MVGGGWGVSGLLEVRRDEASAAFFDAAARGELLMQRCRREGTVLGPEAQTCPDCGSAELAAYPVAGQGILVSWSVVHQAPLPVLADAVPYLSAVVELAEGPWLLVRLVDADPAELAVGAPVQVRFVPSGDDETGEVLPVFTPREPVASG